MNENLNLAELLRDCPKWTKFYSTVYGDVYFDRIDLSCQYPVILKDSEGGMVTVTNGGLNYSNFNGECTLFPSRDQRDWSKWHRPFVDGDVITCTNSCCSFVAIFKETNTDTTFRRYVSLILDDKQQFCTKEGWADFKNPRFATEEEEQKLFNAIKANGYTWNFETKTLEKLIEPKFKVGDTIRTKNGLQTYEVTNVTSEYYSVRMPGCVGLLPVKDQDDYILIPNKFDPNTLIPFESKVLVRDANHFSWIGSIYTHRKDNGFYTINGKCYLQCIPYNDETAHLIGTCKIAPDYYRYWKNDLLFER